MARPAGPGKQLTLWQIPAREGQGFEHGTQKPVACMQRPIENNSSLGHAVYEPFSGSGTTIIAAEITERECHAIELLPQYVDVAVERWQAPTGDAARLDGDGRTFAAQWRPSDESPLSARLCGSGRPTGSGSKWPSLSNGPLAEHVAFGLAFRVVTFSRPEGNHLN
jgi:hypothetical protein